MKLSTTKNNIVSNIQATDQFGMDAKDIPHITHILRNQLYSMKLLAILREYSTNAYDAHADRGIQNIPIEVTLPTITNQNLRIRDFGNGLSENDVMQTYIKYGSSTKRTSNAFTGCLGIGCKSAFAYSNQFTITSYYNNRKQQYLASIDENDTGTISKQVDVPSDESTGVEISIPIQSNDHYKLRDTAHRFFKYWEVKPKVNMDLPTESIYGDINKNTYAMVKENYESKTHNAILLMGNIPYPINVDAVDSKIPSITTTLSCKRLVLKAPLGSVDVAASRESLEYTSKTKNWLITTANQISNDLSSAYNEVLKNEKSIIQASIKGIELLENLEWDLMQIIRPTLKWNNEKLITSFLTPPIAKHYRFHRWRANDYVNKREKDIARVALNQYTKFAVYDKITESNATRRIRTLQNKNNWNKDEAWYLIHANQLSSIKEITSHDYVDLSTIDPMPANRTPVVDSDGNKVVRAKISVCKIQPCSTKSGRLSEEVEPQPERNGKYYYIPLDRYDWMGIRKELEPLAILTDIRNSMASLNYIVNQVEEYPVIYGVKKHHLKNLTDDWVDLTTWLPELYNKAKDVMPYEFTKALNKRSSSDYLFDHGSSARALSEIDNKDISYAASLYTNTKAWYVCASKWAEQPYLKEQSINLITNTMLQLGMLHKTKDRINLEKALRLKYPLLAHIHGYCDKFKESITEYTKLIDSKSNN